MPSDFNAASLVDDLVLRIPQIGKQVEPSLVAIPHARTLDEKADRFGSAPCLFQNAQILRKLKDLPGMLLTASEKADRFGSAPCRIPKCANPQGN
jgi:hypothetical protein